MAASRTVGRPPVSGRWFVLILLVALGAHAVILWAFFDHLLSVQFLVEPDYGELAALVVAAFVLASALFKTFAGRAVAILAVSIATVGASLLSPGTVATVLLMVLSAHVVGDRAIAWLNVAKSGPEVGLPSTIPILVGTCLWIGFIGAALELRVHTPPVYAVMTTLPLLLFPRAAAAASVGFVRWLAQPREQGSWTERGWLALLVAIAVIHIVLVARPEAGYDANTMHLQFAQLLHEHRRWTFDVTRYAWAVMPLGADFGFASAYMLGGEPAARLLNFCYGALLLATTYQLIAVYTRRDIALAAVTVLASTPLLFLETTSLYVENLWSTYLLGALLLALLFARNPRSDTLCAFAFACAGAMATKVISVVWLLPLIPAVAWLAWHARKRLNLDRHVAVLVVVASIIAAWPYANAWLRTGNPVFPFLNTLFKSPLFDTTRPFNNVLYNASLTPWTLYEIVLSSGRFIEGTDGALGTQWLLLIPIVLVGLARRRPRAQWASVGLATFFFLVVYLQQSYLRYLLPALILLTIAAAWVLVDVRDSRVMRITCFSIGALLCLGNLRMLPAAGWWNADLCLKCSYDRETRERFVSKYAPHRIISDYLNSALPNARVGFFLINWPSPSGYTGYSRAANWHDWAVYQKLIAAESSQEVEDVVRSHRLTHIAYSSTDPTVSSDAMRTYAARHSSPVWHFGDYVVAAIKSD